MVMRWSCGCDVCGAIFSGVYWLAGARHFLLFPPMDDDLSAEWRLLMRVARSLTVPSQGWAEVRLFTIKADDHPCELDWSEE